MKTAISELDVRRAASVAEALTLLQSERRTPMAGCTDLYVALNFGTLARVKFVDIWALDDLRAISVHDRTLSIGALATYTSIIRSPLVADRVPMLVSAAQQIGGPQIQNRGTLGGNIANASPAGDSLPVLMACDASVVLQSLDGARRIPLCEFYTGYRATVMRPDELIVAVEIPVVEGRQWFRKVGTRAAQAISKLAMAAVRGGSVRIALGSVAPTVMRAYKTEHALADGANIEEASGILSGEIQPIDDIRSTAEYRRTVAANLLRRFWSDTG